MRFSAVLAAICILLAGPASAGAMSTISLADGTVTANRQDSGTGAGSWFGESVTAVTINAHSPGNWTIVSGEITDISDTENSWVEVGLIPKERWDYWQTAFGGNFKSAVFDKGLYMVHWDEAGTLGLGLKEGWNEGGSTVTNVPHPFAWDLAEPSAGAPWDFAFEMYPTSSGNAYLEVGTETIFGPQPYAYGTDPDNNNDYTECYLFARIWSLTEDATFSFADVQAESVPEPVTMAGLALAVGCLARYVQRRR
jgi:hypothetical protein